MKIGIDARLLSYRRGMGNYVFNLIAALGTLDTANQYVLYVGRLSDAKLALPANFRASVVSSPPYPLWEQVLLPWHAWKDRLEAYPTLKIKVSAAWNHSRSPVPRALAACACAIPNCWDSSPIVPNAIR